MKVAAHNSLEAPKIYKGYDFDPFFLLAYKYYRL